jgi:hypothetical protein
MARKTFDKIKTKSKTCRLAGLLGSSKNSKSLKRKLKKPF